MVNGGGSASPTGGAGSASPTGGAGGGSATNGTGATKPSVTPTATPTGAAAMVSGSVLGLLGVLAVGLTLL